MSSFHFDATGKGFKHLTPTREALRLITSKLPEKVVQCEEVSVSSALHCVLAENVVSRVDFPGFDRAAMDGYAVNAEDTYSASANSPIVLRRISGSGEAIVVSRGEVLPIVTGASMPKGANAVAMSEYSRETDYGSVEVSAEVHPWENVSRIGEDLRSGTVVLKQGQRLLPQDIGMLANLGYDRVKVKRKLRIAVLSTGNELHDGLAKTPGGIRDVNRPTLLNAVREIGCEPIDLGIPLMTSK